jgi:hypothetical protein
MLLTYAYSRIVGGLRGEVRLFAQNDTNYAMFCLSNMQLNQTNAQTIDKIRAMQLYTIGVNHTTAPVSIREHVAFNSETLRDALGDLTAKNAAEAAILSTCNRTEIYVQSSTPEPVVGWLADYHRLELAKVQPYTYTLATKRLSSTPSAWRLA